MYKFLFFVPFNNNNNNKTVNVHLPVIILNPYFTENTYELQEYKDKIMLLTI